MYHEVLDNFGFEAPPLGGMQKNTLKVGVPCSFLHFRYQQSGGSSLCKKLQQRVCHGQFCVRDSESAEIQ